MTLAQVSMASNQDWLVNGWWTAGERLVNGWWWTADEQLVMNSWWTAGWRLGQRLGQRLGRRLGWRVVNGLSTVGTLGTLGKLRTARRSIPDMGVKCSCWFNEKCLQPTYSTIKKCFLIENKLSQGGGVAVYGSTWAGAWDELGNVKLSPTTLHDTTMKYVFPGHNRPKYLHTNDSKRVSQLMPVHSH